MNMDEFNSNFIRYFLERREVTPLSNMLARWQKLDAQLDRYFTAKPCGMIYAHGTRVPFYILCSGKTFVPN